MNCVLEDIRFLMAVYVGNPRLTRWKILREIQERARREAIFGYIAKFSIAVGKIGGRTEVPSQPKRNWQAGPQILP
jgi:hypothetical protein